MRRVWDYTWICMHGSQQINLDVQTRLQKEQPDNDYKTPNPAHAPTPRETTNTQPVNASPLNMSWRRWDSQF